MEQETKTLRVVPVSLYWPLEGYQQSTTRDPQRTNPQAVFDPTFLLAHAHIILKQSEDGHNNNRCNLDELGHYAAAMVLGAFPCNVKERLHVSPNNDLNKGYLYLLNINLMEVSSLIHEINKPFYRDVTTSHEPLLLGTMIDLIAHNVTKDKRRTVRATLTEFLSKLE